MKRLIIILASVVLVLALASPVLAASLGISPSHVEVNVPCDGSSTADLKVHYFSGDVGVSLVDIPLRVEPDILHVDALDGPADIQVTIYGDESLGSQVYNGYIRFLGMSGETVAVAVQVKAKVTNIVEGQPIPEEKPPEEAPPEQVPPAESPPIPPPSAPPPATTPPGETAGLPLSTVIIIAGGLVFLGLVALSISLGVRRRQY